MPKETSNNNKQPFCSGTGRRKTAVARVWLYEKGKAPLKGVIVNDKPIEEYFTDPKDSHVYMRPFQAANVLGKFAASIKVHGGGVRGQLGAIAHGLSRALVRFDPEFRPVLKKEGLLTRDPRMKERKHYFRKSARRREQWSKR